eukprot:6054190-Amphidinium_carterae.1
MTVNVLCNRDVQPEDFASANQSWSFADWAHSPQQIASSGVRQGLSDSNSLAQDGQSRRTMQGTVIILPGFLPVQAGQNPRRWMLSLTHCNHRFFLSSRSIRSLLNDNPYNHTRNWDNPHWTIVSITPTVTGNGCFLGIAARGGLWIWSASVESSNSHTYACAQQQLLRLFFLLASNTPAMLNLCFASMHMLAHSRCFQAT